MKNSDIKIRVIKSKTEKDKEDRFKNKIRFRYLTISMVWLTTLAVVVLQCTKLMSN